MRNMIQFPLKCDVEANWLVNEYCNFRCGYCYFGEKKETFLGEKNIENIADCFSKTGLTWMIYLSGGEPFFAPRFVELCKLLSENHVIAIITNLSHGRVNRFAKTISPEKVRCIHCSLHIEERERLGLVDDFVEKYQRLKEAGFYIFTSYVLHPRLLQRFDRDYQLFKSKGIILRPKVFRGTDSIVPARVLRWLHWDSHARESEGDGSIPIGTNHLQENPYGEKLLGKALSTMRSQLGSVYPEDYSESEREKIIEYMDRSQQDGGFVIETHEETSIGRLSDVSLDKLFIRRLPSHKGKYCGAGMTFVRITPTGDAYRCYSDNDFLGNLFKNNLKLYDKVERCRANVCTCPYMAYRHLLNHDNITG